MGSATNRSAEPASSPPCTGCSGGSSRASSGASVPPWKAGLEVIHGQLAAHVRFRDAAVFAGVNLARRRTCSQSSAGSVMPARRGFLRQSPLKDGDLLPHRLVLRGQRLDALRGRYELGDGGVHLGLQRGEAGGRMVPGQQLAASSWFELSVPLVQLRPAPRRQARRCGWPCREGIDQGRLYSWRRLPLLLLSRPSTPGIIVARIRMHSLARANQSRQRATRQPT